MPDLEQAIREHAYHLWMADGCRDGAADAYWLTAQREVLTASLSNAALATPAAKADAPAKKKAAAKPAAKAATVTAKPAAKSKRRAA